jgi:dihydroflavonol-4-reductase
MSLSDASSAQADTVFITGATGFVGANLARLLLAKGYKVRALVRKSSDPRNLEGLDVERVVGDLTQKQSLVAGCQGARYVFHVAADYRIWVPDPEAMMAANVRGTENVLRAAHEAGVERIVYCSSVAAVRPPSGETPVNEDSHYTHTDEIIGAYKKSKWLAEQAALRLAEEGLPIVIVNPAAPIGPWDAKPTPTGKIVLDFLTGRMPSYIETGLNVVHVEDVAQGHLLAALKGHVGERYILGGENLSLKAILDLLAEETGLPAPRFKTPIALAYVVGALDAVRLALFGGEAQVPLDAVRMAKYKMYYDSSKAWNELSMPRTSARTALRDAACWFVEHDYAPAFPKYRKEAVTA